MDKIINAMSASICELLEIDATIPHIKYEIKEEQYKSRNGYYQYEGDIVCINAEIAANCIIDLKNHLLDGCPNGKMPKTANWAFLTFVLCHELRHREQNIKRRKLYEEEFVLESKLDLNKKEDYDTYEKLSCEIDANAFGMIGSWDLIGTNVALINYVKDREFARISLFSERLVEVFNEYKDEIRPGFMESLAEWYKENS